MAGFSALSEMYRSPLGKGSRSDNLKALGREPGQNQHGIVKWRDMCNLKKIGQLW